MRFVFISLVLIPFLLFGAGEITAVGNPVAMTVAGAGYMAPVWSPDGNILAVTGNNYTGIYLVTFPGGELTVLSEAYSAGYGMQWSPDGSTIAARAARFEGYRRINDLMTIRVMDGRTEILRSSTDLPGTPVWMKDGSLSLSGARNFERFVPDGLAIRELSTPVWVQLSERLVRLSAADEHVLAATSSDEQVTGWSQSPDGAWIAFSTGGEQLWLMDDTGRERISLGSGVDPVWSPDGGWIACIVTRDDGHEILDSDIFLISRESRSRINLTRSPGRVELHPAWSPDGKWIAFDSLGEAQVFVQQVEGR